MTLFHCTHVLRLLTAEVDHLRAVSLLSVLMARVLLLSHRRMLRLLLLHHEVVWIVADCEGLLEGRLRGRVASLG